MGVYITDQDELSEIIGKLRPGETAYFELNGISGQATSELTSKEYTLDHDKQPNGKLADIHNIMKQGGFKYHFTDEF